MKLKPCPWCNEPPRDDNMIGSKKNRWWFLFCGNCGATGPREHTEAKARRAWNDRA